jgi:putative phosphoesterase
MKDHNHKIRRQIVNFAVANGVGIIRMEDLTERCHFETIFKKVDHKGGIAMKVLIISDSHGKTNLLSQVVKRVKADHVIHCGDFCTDEKELPSCSLTVVRGNCDWEPVPEEQVWEKEGLRFFVTHGHRYRVKTTLLPIRYRAEELGAQIACFGHSHFPFCEKAENVLLINPGSIIYPRGFLYPTYAVLEAKGNQLKVTYYKTDGTPIKERGYKEG